MASGTRTRDWAELDFYAILGVPVDATDEQIAGAYRALAKRLHPDSGATDAEIELFKEIAAANAVLGHPARRRDYDHVRGETRPPSTAPTAVRPAPASRPLPPSRGLTRSRARLALIGGIVAVLAGVGVAVLTLNLRADDAAARKETIAVDARRVDGGIEFVTAEGEVVHTREPDHQEASGVGSFVPVRYYPEAPTRVVADENRSGRDITLAIVALKLLIGGAALAGFGARRLMTRS